MLEGSEKSLVIFKHTTVFGMVILFNIRRQGAYAVIRFGAQYIHCAKGIADRLLTSAPGIARAATKTTSRKDPGSSRRPRSLTMTARLAMQAGVP